MKGGYLRHIVNLFDCCILGQKVKVCGSLGYGPNHQIWFETQRASEASLIYRLWDLILCTEKSILLVQLVIVPLT